MSDKGFPPITYGRDSRHGRRGPEYSDPGPDMAPNRGYEGSGQPLKKFRGVWLDHLSVIELEDLDAVEIELEKDRQDKEFISKCGFTTDGSTLQ